MFKNILDEYHVLAGSGGLSCVDLQDILDAHNTARQNVALGRIAGQPAAANMLEMVSDKKMADVSDCAERERERAYSSKGKTRDEKTAMVPTMGYFTRLHHFHRLADWWFSRLS